MRLIDADALLKEMRVSGKAAYMVVQDAPTIEAEPVQHGRWEECDWVEFDGHNECVRYPKKGRICTNCRNVFKKEFIDDRRVRHCPHCGAKMDGEAHE